jgi:hypothetical protein
MFFAKNFENTQEHKLFNNSQNFSPSPIKFNKNDDDVIQTPLNFDKVNEDEDFTTMA